jgi:anti-anti-sigma factor
MENRQALAVHARGYPVSDERPSCAAKGRLSPMYFVKRGHPQSGKEILMEITERQIPNGTVLELQGDLTHANRREFMRAVEAVRQKDCRHLILHMGGVRFLDSSGLGLLALISQHFKSSQGTVSIAKPQSYVREILVLANIPKLIPVYDNEQDALAGSQDAA